MLLQNTGGQLFRKTLKLFRSDLERTSKDTTLSKNQSTYEHESPSWRGLIHHRIRAQQSGLSGAGQSPEYLLRRWSGPQYDDRVF